MGDVVQLKPAASPQYAELLAEAIERLDAAAEAMEEDGLGLAMLGAARESLETAERRAECPLLHPKATRCGCGDPNALALHEAARVMRDVARALRERSRVAAAD